MTTILEFYNKVHSRADGKFANTPGPGHAKGAPKATPAQKAALKKVLAKPKTKAGSVVVANKTAAKTAAPKSGSAGSSAAKKEPEKEAAPVKKTSATSKQTKPEGMNEGPPPKGLGVGTLSDKNIQALDVYVTETYKTINGSLRIGSYRSENKKVRDTIKEMDDAFDKAPVTTEDIVVYRAMNQREFLKAKTIKDPGYISTSYNEENVKTFARTTGGVGVIKIVIPKGSKVLKLSNERGEAEMLLPRDGRFDRQKDGTYKYKALERDSQFTRQADGSYWFKISFD